MAERPQQNRKVGPAYIALVAATPLVFVALQVIFGSAPVSMLWFGLGMSIVAFVLFRFLSGFVPFGRRRLHFGRSSAPLRIWQAPVLWVAVVVVVAIVSFWWFAA